MNTIVTKILTNKSTRAIIASGLLFSELDAGVECVYWSC